MATQTRLEPLEQGRARELLGLMTRHPGDATKGLALDEQGRVTGIVESDDPRERHLLSDLDVHA